MKVKGKFLMRGLPVIGLSILMMCRDIGQVRLWPNIEPYQTGYLQVSERHNIYYECCGNPAGKPVFVLHGGPGGSCSPYMRRFFNPDKYRIVLHDQRGSGKSRPFGETRENTTQHLVQDMEALRQHLNIEKMILFGGSWGSTLGLVYAETYPEHVEGLVLRGIFTATQQEIDHFYHGGVRKFFPEVYDRFTGAIENPDDENLPGRLMSLIQSPDSSKQAFFSRLWAAYEIKISGLVVPEDTLKNILDNFNPYAFGMLENYYMANGCFLEEGQIFSHLQKIEDIPVILINGRYDMICPPVTAYELHLKLPKSKLVIAEQSGHWMGEKSIETALLKAMTAFE